MNYFSRSLTSSLPPLCYLILDNDMSRLWRLSNARMSLLSHTPLPTKRYCHRGTLRSGASPERAAVRADQSREPTSMPDPSRPRAPAATKTTLVLRTLLSKHLIYERNWQSEITIIIHVGSWNVASYTYSSFEKCYVRPQTDNLRPYYKISVQFMTQPYLLESS